MVAAEEQRRDEPSPEGSKGGTGRGKTGDEAICRWKASKQKA